MKRQKKTKYFHEGRYVAEVDVELIEDESERSPYFSLEDAYKLDNVRDALCPCASAIPTDGHHLSPILAQRGAE